MAEKLTSFTVYRVEGLMEEGPWDFREVKDLASLQLHLKHASDTREEAERVAKELGEETWRNWKKHYEEGQKRSPPRAFSDIPSPPEPPTPFPVVEYEVTVACTNPVGLARLRSHDEMVATL